VEHLVLVILSLLLMVLYVWSSWKLAAFVHRRVCTHEFHLSMWKPRASRILSVLFDDEDQFYRSRVVCRWCGYHDNSLWIYSYN
jgi:hypothetical protein